jgi:hypothetical protein
MGRKNAKTEKPKNAKTKSVFCSHCTVWTVMALLLLAVFVNSLFSLVNGYDLAVKSGYVQLLSRRITELETRLMDAEGKITESESKLSLITAAAKKTILDTTASEKLRCESFKLKVGETAKITNEGGNVYLTLNSLSSDGALVELAFNDFKTGEEKIMRLGSENPKAAAALWQVELKKIDSKSSSATLAVLDSSCEQ